VAELPKDRLLTPRLSRIHAFESRDRHGAVFALAEEKHEEKRSGLSFPTQGWFNRSLVRTGAAGEKGDYENGIGSNAQVVSRIGIDGSFGRPRARRQ
jgi:hypothetical protein